ncbi:g6284 [Coccomyxa viridis]|uniref:G6284 protein n=1 Tax=Coccomyxa viridis TaxID=1274662 RepID=A0ABP1G1M9_9CHLO
MTAKIPKHPLVPGKPDSFQVSVLGMGTSPLGHAYGTPDEEAGLAAIVEAFNKGINFYDTAPFYGGGSAERLLGRALKKLPRHEVFVTTKVGKYGPGQPADFTGPRVTRSVSESLERLDTEYIDLILIHDVEYVDDLKEIINDTLPALVKLRESGKVKYVGFSGLPLDAFTYILDRVPKGTVDAVLSYCHNTLNDKSLIDLLPYFAEKSVGVISASVTSMGLFTKQGALDWHPAPKPVLQAAIQAREKAASHGVDIGTLAIKEAARPQGIAVTLVGMRTPDEVNTDVQIVLEALGLVESKDAKKEEAAMKDVNAILKPHMGATWVTGNPNNKT